MKHIPSNVRCNSETDAAEAGPQIIRLHVVFGGIHATLYPTEAHELGGAHAVVKGDGD
jgi:hypothetical protein